jgi:lipoprotein-releasing system permease protein
MIVVEKTRDMWHLQSAGRSEPRRDEHLSELRILAGLGWVRRGHRCWGCCSLIYINQVAVALERLTGRPIFDPTVYYFREIPTIVEPITVIGVMVGAIAIAVLASVLPARRAARLHPVEALRYE